MKRLMLCTILLTVLISSQAHAFVEFHSYTSLPVRNYSEFEGFENPLDYSSNAYNYYLNDFTAYFSTASRMSIALTANGYGDEGRFALLTSFNYNNQYIEFTFNKSLSSLLFYIDSEETEPSELYGTVYDGNQLVHSGHDYYLKTISNSRYIEYTSVDGKFDRIRLTFNQNNNDYPRVSFDRFQYEFYDEGTATPVPGAVWLLGTGLVGVVGLRRKLTT